jgi:hypothetical protein
MKLPIADLHSIKRICGGFGKDSLQKQKDSFMSAQVLSVAQFNAHLPTSAFVKRP